MWFSTPQAEAVRSWGPGLFLQLRNCGSIEEITKQAGTFKDIYCSLKRHTGLPAKSLLLLADKNKGKVRPKSSWNSTEKYNPPLLEFLMQKSPVSPQEVRKGERNWRSNGILQGIEHDPMSFNISPDLPKALTTFQPQAGLYFIKWNVSISPSPPPSPAIPSGVLCETEPLPEPSSRGDSSWGNTKGAAQKSLWCVFYLVVCTLSFFIRDLKQVSAIIIISKQTNKKTHHHGQNSFYRNKNWTLRPAKM